VNKQRGRDRGEETQVKIQRGRDGGGRQKNRDRGGKDKWEK
jgi:hypothetical protein